MAATAESAAATELCAELYARYRDDVYRYTLALLRRRVDAEDATQTTFLNAYRAMAQGERPWKPKQWLITIAHNACRTRAIRAARRPYEVPLDPQLPLAAPEPVDGLSLRVLLHDLAQLPENQRAALVQRELEGRSYVEIAEALGVTVSAVETLIFRARRALRQRSSIVRGAGLAWLPGWLHRLASSFGAGGVPEGVAVAAAAAVIAAGGAGGAVPARDPVGVPPAVVAPSTLVVHAPAGHRSAPRRAPVRHSSVAVPAAAPSAPPPAATSTPPPSPPPATPAEPPASTPAPPPAAPAAAPQPATVDPGASAAASTEVLPPVDVSTPILDARLPAVDVPVETPVQTPSPPPVTVSTQQVPALSGI